MTPLVAENEKDLGVTINKKLNSGTTVSLFYQKQIKISAWLLELFILFKTPWGEGFSILPYVVAILSTTLKFGALTVKLW